MINKYLYVLAGLAILMVCISCGKDPADTGWEYAPQMFHSIPLEPFSQKDSNTVFANGLNAQKFHQSVQRVVQVFIDFIKCLVKVHSPTPYSRLRTLQRFIAKSSPHARCDVPPCDLMSALISLNQM